MARPKREQESVSQTINLTKEAADTAITAVSDNRDIFNAPKDGTRIYLSEKIEDEGVLSYWKSTRLLLKYRWKISGKWVDAFGQNLGFEPKYWKSA